MPRIRRTRDARADVAGIWRHIAIDNFDAAERWLATLDAKIKLLAEFPGMGPMRDEFSPGLQSYPVGKYLIFYRKMKGGIEIIRVLHGARNLPEIFGA
jgi:toxin ParE1/3/4